MRDQDEVLFKPVLEQSNKRTRTSAPGTPRKSKKPRESSPPQLTIFFPPSPKDKVRKSKSASPSPHPMVNELSILDTKTRRSNWLPSDDDAYSSRMQLMLYHHLLSALLAPTFSFNAFWEKIRADPFAQLSDAFLLQSGLARGGSDGVVVQKYHSCLDDLTDLWRTTLRSMNVRGLSPALEIVYRAQPKRSTLNHFAVAEREARDIAHAIASSMRDTDSDLERAIAESLRDMVPATDADDGGNARSSSPRATERPSDKTKVPWYVREGAIEQTEPKAMGSAWPMEVPSSPGEPSSSSERDVLPPPEAPRIIGRKHFTFDEDTMHAHVQNVMKWWRGERAPQGVDIEHVRRCS
jgi:exonuclease V